MTKIRIISPAKSIDHPHVDFAEEFLKAQGFEVEIGTYALGKYNYFSGTIEERLSDFQFALDDQTVDVILCSRGGYGSVQLIDGIDFSGFVSKPKLIIGYSDLTVFHNHIPKYYGLNTVHATAPLNFMENTPEALNSMVNVIKGVPNRYELEPHSLNINGTVREEVTGGNLSIIYSLLGTNSDADYDGKILFIEEIGEPVYSVDRMFYALKKAGKLSQIKGLIVGGLTKMTDSEIPYGKSVEEVIKAHVENFNIPVCFNFPAGHINDNRAIIIGREATLSVDADGVLFEQ